MRLKLTLLLLILVISTCGYDPVKSNDKDKALAYAKSKKEKATKAVLVKEDEDTESKSLDDIEKDAGFKDDLDEEEDDAPKKKTQKKHPKKQQTAENKSKKNKRKEEDVKTVSDTAAIPNMTSFDFFQLARENRLDKLRDIINDTPVGDIEKMREITEEIKEDYADGEDANEYQACNYDTSGDDELCHCDMDEINCNSIVMESDDPHLRTADLSIMKKGFKPIIANFSDNAISRLQRNKVLPGFEKHVSVLDFSHNQLRFVDSDVFKPFTNLSKLNLSYNNLQNVKKPLFDSVKNTLHRLDIGYNRIKSLADNVFEGLSNLKILTLDGNPIKSWRKEMFKGLDNLETLSMDDCKIDSLPADIFEYLPKLIGVSLRGNPLDEIPSVVANLKSLKSIDMSLTNLTEIRDHAFAGDSDLEEIILEKMPFLSAIRDCGFCGLPILKILLLNDNRELMEIHPNAFGFINSQPGHKASAIVEFAIHNSNISTLSEHMMNYDKLNVFKVGGNPWHCDCSAQFLLEENFSFKQDSIAPKCASPPALKDRHLATVRDSDACEDARFLGRSGRFSSVLGLALLVAFLAVGSYYMVSSGKLSKLVRRVRKEPEVSYTNLQVASEDFALETDFQPRPAEV